MKPVLRWLVLGIVALFAIPVAAVVALLVIDAEVYRDALTDEISSATGRPFVIEGPLRISPSLTPTLVAERVRLGNPPSGAKGDILRVERFEARLPLIPLLRGDVRIERLTLVRPEIVLVPDGKGSGNWAMAMPIGQAPRQNAKESAPDAKLRISIRDARLRDGTLRYVDPAGAGDRLLTITEARLRAVSPASNTQVSVTGAYGGEAFKIEGDGPALDAIGAAAAWPVTLNGTFSTATFAVSGTIAAPVTSGAQPPVESRLAINAEIGEVARLGQVLGVEVPPMKPIQVKGGVALSGDRLHVDDLDATIGGSRFSGTLEMSFAGVRPLVKGTLAGESVDLADFGITPSDMAGAAPVPQVSAARGARTHVFSDAALPLERLGDVDLDLALTAARVIAGKVDVAHVAANVSLHDRALAAAPLRVEMAGGVATGELRIDGTAALPSVAGRLEWRGVDLAAFLAMTGADLAIAGKTNLMADFRGRGISIRGLAASLDGSLAGDLTNGHLPGTLFDLLGEDLAARLLSITDSKQVTPLRCGIARFAIRGGVAESEALAIDSAKISLTGTGRTDLGREVLDFVLVPRPKDPSLMSLGIPVVIRGTYLSPEFIPDKGAAVGGLLGGAIGTILLGPLGVLIPLASTGTGEITDCIRLMRETREPPAPSDPDTQTPDRALPRSDNPIDNIRGLFRNLERRLTR